MQPLIMNFAPRDLSLGVFFNKSTALDEEPVSHKSMKM